MYRREFLSTSLTGLLSTWVGSDNKTLSPTSQKEEKKQIQFALSIDSINSNNPEYLLSQLRKINSLLPVDNKLAIEDYGFCGKPVQQQNEISHFLKRNELQMGLFAGSVHYGQPLFSSGRTYDQQIVLQQIWHSFELTNGLHTQYCSIIPGSTMHGVSWKKQSSNALELLKKLSDIAANNNRTLLLEPVNYLDKNSGLFINSVTKAYELCERLNHPCCKILYNFRQQIILERDIFKDIAQFGHQIGYYQFESCDGLITTNTALKNISQNSLNQILAFKNREPVMIGNFPVSL